MRDKKESLYPQDWFRKGEQDLKAAKVLLSSDNLETASFHLHQAVEKYLKGYLLSKGWKLRRIHDLEELLDETITYNKSFKEFREVTQMATEY
jgi:HEPN domain-containing protein